MLCPNQSRINPSMLHINLLITSCSNALKKDNHCKTQRYSRNFTEFTSSKAKEKRSSASMKVRGIDFTHLLLGEVQLGGTHNLQRELLTEELFLRGVVAPSNEKITVLKQCLLADE